MPAQRVVLAGGSGFLGQSLAADLLAEKYEVIVLTRTPGASGLLGTGVAWDGSSLGDWTPWLDGALAVVNLTGKSINCRPTAENLRGIVRSRVESVNVLTEGRKAFARAARRRSSRSQRPAFMAMQATGFATSRPVPVLARWPTCVVNGKMHFKTVRRRALAACCCEWESSWAARMGPCRDLPALPDGFWAARQAGGGSISVGSIWPTHAGRCDGRSASRTPTAPITSLHPIRSRIGSSCESCAAWCIGHGARRRPVGPCGSGPDGWASTPIWP